MARCSVRPASDCAKMLASCRELNAPGNIIKASQKKPIAKTSKGAIQDRDFIRLDNLDCWLLLDVF